MSKFPKNIGDAREFNVNIAKQSTKIIIKYFLSNIKISIDKVSKWSIYDAKIVYWKAKRLYYSKIK